MHEVYLPLIYTFLSFFFLFPYKNCVESKKLKEKRSGQDSVEDKFLYYKNRLNLNTEVTLSYLFLSVLIVS